MHAADRDDDVIGAHVMLGGDRGAKAGIARGRGIAETELAQGVGIPVNQIGEPKVGADAFGEVMPRRAADQRNDLVSGKSRHRIFPRTGHGVAVRVGP